MHSLLFALSGVAATIQRRGPIAGELFLAPTFALMSSGVGGYTYSDR